MDAGYWRALKSFYEEDYTGIVAGDKAMEYAEELSNGGATVIEMGHPFIPDQIRDWIRDSEMNYSTDDEPDRDDFDDDDDGEDEYQQAYSDWEDESLLSSFPSFYEYKRYVDEIAAYLMQKDLDLFAEMIRNGQQDFIDFALDTNWGEMLDENPGLDIFRFD